MALKKVSGAEPDLTALGIKEIEEIFGHKMTAGVLRMLRTREPDHAAFLSGVILGQLCEIRRLSRMLDGAHE